MGWGRTWGIDKIDGDCKHAVAISSAFAAKEIPAGQGGSEFGEVWGAVESVG